MIVSIDGSDTMDCDDVIGFAFYPGQVED